MSSQSDSIVSERGPLRPGPSLASVLLAVLGVGLLALGATLGVGVLPAWWEAKLGDAAPAVMAAGVVLCGLAVLAKSSRAQAQMLFRRTDPAPFVHWLEARLTEVEGSFGVLRELQQAQGNALGLHEQKLELMRQEARAASAKDAVFRLAASLDQLGARVDQRVGDVRDTLERAILELDARVDSVRVELERRFQETIHSIGTLSAEETLASTFDGSFDYAGGDARSALELTAHDETPKAGELALELERERPPSRVPAVGLGVLETITDEPAPSDEREPPAPLPAIHRDDALVPAVEPVRPPTSIPFPRPLDPRSPGGWWSDADRARRG